MLFSCPVMELFEGHLDFGSTQRLFIFLFGTKLSSEMGWAGGGGGGSNIIMFSPY